MELTATDILELLGEDLPQREAAARLDLLADGASPGAVVAALGEAVDPDLRTVLCDILGRQRAAIALDALVTALSDGASSVRGAAADAIGKVFGYVEQPPVHRRADVTEALLRRWRVEESDAVRSTLAQTLALVGDPSVRAALESALSHPDRRVRGQAAWGLRYLANGLSG